MRLTAHLLIGIAAFIFYSWLSSGLAGALGLMPQGPWLAGLFLAAAGAAMPDLLEPAKSWSHRGIFHSTRILSVAVWGFAAAGVLGLVSPGAWYCSAFLLGYVSHLAADSTTKAGLPR